METTMSYSPLNLIQLHLLKMFAYNKREEGLQEMRSVLYNYYKKKLRQQTDAFWESNHLDNARMEQIMYGHNRISTK